MQQSNLGIGDYYPAPFWFLNHELEKAELRLQLQLMKEQGIKAFFIHPRAGLLTAYGSRKWFEKVRWIVEEAEKLGLNTWLYDEDPFPSGAAGGRIFLDNPELAARALVFRKFGPFPNGQVDLNLGEGRLIEAQAVRCDEAGNVVEKIDLFEDVGVLRSDFFHTEWMSSYYVHLIDNKKYPHHRSETFFPHLQLQCKIPKDWLVYSVCAELVEGTKYRYLPDNLNPKCAEKFIELTHEKYKKYLGEKLSKSVKGIFTDETSVGASVPWTKNLESEFMKRNKFGLKNEYYRLFTGNCEDNQAFRLAYWETVQELFIESFFKPVNNWCNEHGLLLCGHGIAEENPLSSSAGLNVFNLQKYVGIPGFDHITINIPDGKKVKSLNLGGKLVASAAEQLGEHRVQSECFGCTPYNFGHDGMKKNLHWLYSLGVNWLVPHGFHYSYDGRRKDDAGKSFFFQSPDYNDFHKFGNYAARLGYLLGESRSCTRLCVLFPEKTFRRLLPAESSFALVKREELYNCIQFLIDKQIQFNLTDEMSLENASIGEGSFKCGNCTYDSVLLPFDLENDCLQKLAKNNIKVLSLTKDTEIVLQKSEVKILDADSKALAEQIMLQYRENSFGQLVYVFNNSEKHRVLLLEENAQSELFRYFYDANNDEHFAIESTEETFDLAPYGAMLIELRKEKLPKCRVYQKQKFVKPDFSYMQNPQWDYIPDIEGLLYYFKDWEWFYNGEECGRHRFCLLREITGTEGKYSKIMKPRPIFDQAPEVKSIYPRKLKLKNTFELKEMPNKLVLLAENDSFQGKMEIYLNKKKILPFKRKKYYDAWNIETEISEFAQIGENIIEIQWENAGEFDGINSIIYLLGKSE